MTSIFKLLKAVYAILRRIFTFTLFGGPILVFLYALLAKFESVIYAMDALHTAMANAATRVAPFISDGFFAKINTVLPVSEIMGMLSVLLTLKLGAVTVRMLKTFIPGLS